VSRSRKEREVASFAKLIILMNFGLAEITKYTLNRRMPSSGMLCRVTLVRIDITFSRVLLRLLITANVVPSSPILATLMVEEIHSSETSVLTRATRRHIQEDGLLHSHRRENLNSYSIN
jgi:hypothetical protein